MNGQTTHGTVPRIADILMVGVHPQQFERIQRRAEDGLNGKHAGWSVTANLENNFNCVINDFLPRRKNLDLVYMANQMNRSPDELRSEATRLNFEMAKHPGKPYIVLAPEVAWLAPIFHARCIKVHHSIEGAMEERYAEKCRIAEREPA